ncbi:MAG: hypothetical protein GW938_00010 [Leptospira sp.]|nr:hypothetical protein [Leptospira sp.]NCS94562.1 hypothetical protein [Leptospira sp.]
MKHSIIFLGFILIVLTNMSSCKEESPSVATNTQSVTTAPSDGSDEVAIDRPLDSETLQAPIDNPLIKDPQCISKPTANFYDFDPSREKDYSPDFKRPFLTYIPWVEKEGNIAKVHFIDYCSKDNICKYERKFMFSADLGDCTKLSNPIVQKFLDKKPLSEILPNLTLYGSQFKSDGTSTVEEISILKPKESYPSRYFSSFRWDVKDSKLTVRIAMAEQDVCSPNEDGSDSGCDFCKNEKDKFNALHSEDSNDSCMFYSHKKLKCEITDIKLSDDRSILIFNAIQLGADEEIPSDFCKMNIKIKGNLVKPLEIR